MSTDSKTQADVKASLDAGHLKPQDLSLAAYLGDAVALKLCDQEAAPTEKLSDWVWGIALWGKIPLVQMTLALAETALPVAIDCGTKAEAAWKSWHDLETAGQALELAKAFLRDPQYPMDRLPYLVDATSKATNAAYFNADEAGGTAERVQSLWRAAAIFEAIEYLITVIAWQPASLEDNHYGIDENELRARNSAGPALEAWKSVYASNLVLRWDQQETMQFVRSVLVPWKPAND